MSSGGVNIVLIGLRGSGKTTVGRKAAAALGRPFVDLDDLTPKLLGASSVAAAWSRCGERSFREAETRALAGVLENGGQVIALGGGTPTAPGAADLLRKERDALSVRLIYLHASADDLRERLGAADLTNRPTLTGANPLAEIDVVLARRDPLYRELAGTVVEIGGRAVEDVVADVLRVAGGS